MERFILTDMLICLLKLFINIILLILLMGIREYMKKKLIPLLITIASTLVGCTTNNNIDNSEQGDQDVKLTYEDIYHYEYSKVEPKSGKNIYRASDGYIDNQEQGYNHFFYRARVNNTLLDMVYTDGMFVNEGASLNNKVIRSSRLNFLIFFTASKYLFSSLSIVVISQKLLAFAISIAE